MSEENRGRSGSHQHRGGSGRDHRNFRRNGAGDRKRRFERRDGERRYSNRGERDGERRYERRDGEHREHRYGDRDGEHRFRRDGEGFERRGKGNRSFDRKDHKRNNDRQFNRRDHNRGNANRDAKGSQSFYESARQNSDGTISYPSQNPYTDRRPNEPVMPKGIEWSMLSRDERDRLRGLSKEHAENIGLHMLAAYSLADTDPQWALQHAQWIAKQASRIDMARETLAFLAYRQGDYKLALREFKTAFRMNGFLDYLPFIADCERGLGHPERAIEVALSDDAKQLRGESKAEMFLVLAGAQGDLGNWDKAIDIVHTLGRSRGISGEYRMRALQAEQNFLEQAGRLEESAQLDDLVERLEDEYADIEPDDEEVVIDNDLEDVSDDILEGLGIDLHPVTEEDAEHSEESATESADGDAEVDTETEALSEEPSSDESSTDISTSDELADPESDQAEQE